MEIVNYKTTLKDLYKNTSYIKYKKNLYYGWNLDDDICLTNPSPLNVWPDDDIVKSLNELADLDDKKLADIIPYSNSNKELDFIILKQSKCSKVAIVTAGGGYSSVCTAVESLPVGMYLYKKGFTVILPTYSIKEKAFMCKATEDLVDLIKYLTKNSEMLNIDMSDYIIGGFSAGGHAVAMLLTEEYSYEAKNYIKPKLVFLGYPVITLKTSTHGGSKQILLGNNANSLFESKYSVDENMKKAICKLFFWQCERDNIVPFQNFKLLEQAAIKCNYNYEARHYDSDAHGWGIATGKLADGWLDEMLEFLAK